MCTDAAAVLERQGCQEYGYGKFSDEPAQAKKLHLMWDNRSDIPTNNLESEQNLTVFEKRASLTRFKNKTFTAKDIPNDCTLHRSDTFHNAK